MKKLLIELLQCVAIAVIMFFPFFYYLLVMMKP